MDDGGGTPLVAWLALAVAAASFLWQAVDALRRRKTRISVHVRHAAVPTSILEGPELLSARALGLETSVVMWPADEELHYVVAIVAINEGETTEYVQDIRIVNLEATEGAGSDDGSGSRELPPRNRVTWVFPVDRVPIDLARGFFAVADLASGRHIQSGPHHLMDELQLHISRHNAGRPGDGGSAAQPPEHHPS